LTYVIKEAVYDGSGGTGKLVSVKEKTVVRSGECNRKYDCAKLNCCGDCEYLEKRGVEAYCMLEPNKPETCKESPIYEHWRQQTYWNRGKSVCSFSFTEGKEEVVAV